MRDFPKSSRIPYSRTCTERGKLGAGRSESAAFVPVGRDVLIDDFYVPCLEEAVIYDRAVGYFSSTLYHVLALAFSDFVQRGGHMRLVCSPALTPEDFAAMKEADQIGRYAQSTVRADLEMLLSRPASSASDKTAGNLDRKRYNRRAHRFR